MLTLKNIYHQFGAQTLFQDLNITLFAKQKVGVVGRNGAGKSTLFKIILGELQPAKGEVLIASNLQVATVEQEIENLSETAIDYVIAGYPQVGKIYLAIKQAERDEDYEKLAELHMHMAELQGYAVEAQASEILHGLGFSDEEFHHSVGSFSGGWRVRLNLARCLLVPSELMLLDEPTNHLDIDALFWLEDWLKQYSGTLLVISHDRDFLDNVTNYCLAIEYQQAKLYSGGYSSYEQQKAAHQAAQMAAFQKQERFKAHLQKFVNRFRAKASKAKQAQSRMKMLEKLPEILLAQEESDFNFEFFEPKPCGNPLLVTENLSFRYDEPEVLANINLSLRESARIGLLGLNGAGKTTLIKLLVGELQPSAGKIVKNNNLQVGYFAQHQLEALNANQTPLESFREIAMGKRESELRGYLGQFGFSGDKALRKIEQLSGGEKARLALALIIWQRPNLLLLDEPTNHLDMSMRESLTLALQSYDGALIIVAHDRHLLRSTVDEFWLLHNHKLSDFKGDLDDYHEWSAKHHSIS